MNITKRRQYVSRTILLSIVALMVLNACVGKRETKPTLTSSCNIDWQQQAGISSSDVPNPNVSDGLHVLVWNIHDRLLPGSIFSSKGHSEEEVVCIGDLASQYDMVLFQEAFVRPVQIAQYTKHPWADHPFFLEGGGGDQFPLRLVCEICLTPGLLMLAQEKPGWVYGEPYRSFAGRNTKLDKADESFSKGFQLVRFPEFWVLNSHMDAGRGQASRDARASQAWQITAALKWYVPSTAPLLIGMDSNLKPHRTKQDGGEQDGKILQTFLKDNDLTLVLQDGPDIIAVRNLQIKNSHVLNFKETVLSDHNALSIVIAPPSSPE